MKNAEFLRLPHTNKNLLWSVRQRMIFRYEKHKDDASLLLLEAEAEGLSDDGDGSDKEGRPASEDSGDEDPAVAARRLREEIELVRDERPSADGVDQVEPCQGDAWEHQTMEQRLSAAWSAPAAEDLRVGAAGTFEDGVRVDPRYDWQSLPGTVSASHAATYKRMWSEWREAGGVAEGDGVARDRLDVWGRFAFDVVETKAAAREQWLARGRLSRRLTQPLRLILSGGAGSGKSTAIRAIVRAQR